MLRNRATETRNRRKKPNFEEKIRFLFSVLRFLFIVDFRIMRHAKPVRLKTAPTGAKVSIYF